MNYEYVAVIGSRDYRHRERVRAYVRKLPANTIVVSGGALGPDAWGELEARVMGLGVLIFTVRRDDLRGVVDSKIEFIRRAYKRNRVVVDHAHRVVAFLSKERGGTWDAINYARKVGKPVEIIDDDDRDGVAA